MPPPGIPATGTTPSELLIDIYNIIESQTQTNSITPITHADLLTNMVRVLSGSTTGGGNNIEYYYINVDINAGGSQASSVHFGVHYENGHKVFADLIESPTLGTFTRVDTNGYTEEIVFSVQSGPRLTIESQFPNPAFGIGTVYEISYDASAITIPPGTVLWLYESTINGIPAYFEINVFQPQPPPGGGGASPP